VLLILPIVTAVVITFMVRTRPRARYLFDYAILHLPVTGEILQKIILARFANFFALMYRSGITILGAVKTSEDIVANRVIADGLQRGGASRSMPAKSMSEAFQNSRHVSSIGNPDAQGRRIHRCAGYCADEM